jgi:hypothetical protein
MKEAVFDSRCGGSGGERETERDRETERERERERESLISFLSDSLKYRNVLSYWGGPGLRAGTHCWKFLRLWIRG